MKTTIFTTIIILLSLIACKEEKTKQLESTKKDKQTLPISAHILDQGNDIAKSTFLTLGKALKAAMKSGGVEKAVKYCNLSALPITDSLSKKYNVIIKRTSDKVRNPKNKATPKELDVIARYKDNLYQNKRLNAVVAKDIKANKHYYAPILVDGLCLACHGSKENIPDYPIIASLYPDDQATGYKVGELRGIWSIKWANKD